MTIPFIIFGGQIGADRAALDWATTTICEVISGVLDKSLEVRPTRA